MGGPPAPRAALQPAASLPGERTDPSAFCLPAGVWDIPAASVSPGQGGPRGPHLPLPASRQGAELSGSCPHPGTHSPWGIFCPGCATPPPWDPAARCALPAAARGRCSGRDAEPHTPTLPAACPRGPDGRRDYWNLIFR